MANIKLGTDTLTGVNKIRVRNADADGQYVSFGLGGAPAGTYLTKFSVNNNIVGEIALPQGAKIQANPYTPSIEGQAFVAWKTGDNTIQFPYTPTDDTVLTAVFSADAIYGVSGIGASDPTLTRTYDNIGKSYVIDAATGRITTDFDDIFNFETVEQDYNTMIKIPKLYRRVDSVADGSIEAFSISTRKYSDDFVVYPCFLDIYGRELDYILVSKGKATGTTSKATCVSGLAPLNSLTRSAMRTAARANGDQWQQYDWMVHQLIRDLFCVVFATTNTQLIFSGATTGGGRQTVGTTWSMSSPCGWDLTTKQCRFFGLEDIFGNVWDWCDGITFDGSSIYSTTNITQFSDSVSNMTLSGSRGGGGWITSCSYNTNQPFLNFPTANGSGSQSTYYCDQVWSNTETGYHVCMVGTGTADGTRAGLWATFTLHDSKAIGSDIGGRLVYRPL